MFLGQENLFAEIISDLEENITTVLLMPNGVDIREVESFLADSMRELSRMFSSSSLFLEQCESQSPVTALSEVFDVPWKDAFAPRTVEGLIQNGLGLPEIILLRTFDALKLASKDVWVHSILDFQEYAVKFREKVPAFCFLASATDETVSPLTKQLGVKVRYWYNLCTQAEIQAYFQRHLDRRFTEDEVWKMALLSSLVGARMELGVELEHVLDQGLDDIFRQMVQIALRVGWSAEDLRVRGIEQFLYRHCYTPLENPTTPREVRQLWALGLLDYQAEYGWEIAPWVLAVLGERHAFRYRVWRAQLGVVMPIINRLRLLVAQELVLNHGDIWLTWSLPYEELEVELKNTRHPLEVEPRVLVSLLEYHESKLWKEQVFLKALKRAHSLRNQLAHYEAIEFAEYRQLIEEMDELNRHLY